MATHHRRLMHRFLGWTRRPSGSLAMAMPLRSIGVAAIIGIVASCGPGDTQVAPATLEGEERMHVIVNLVVDRDAGDDVPTPEAIAVVRDRFLDRLRTRLNPEDMDSIRTFAFLPAVALAADGDLLVDLLAMPEVGSVERDRELMPLEADAPPDTSR